MDHYLDNPEKVLETLGTSDAGLSRQEADKRLLGNGKNELAKPKGKSLLRRLGEQLVNPMVLILLAAAAISTMLAIIHGGGVSEYAEVGIILAVIVINSILGIYQESKAEKSIEALQEMSAATAKVKREGFVSVIHASELVVGDVVLLEAGDAIPADMRLIQCASLRIEEAALTGESVPVSKCTDKLKPDLAGDIPLGDRKNMAYMGSSAVYGRGEGVVTATGMATELGKIADIIRQAEEGETPLQKRLSQLSKVLTITTLIICAVVFAVMVLREGFTPETLTHSFMIAVALAVAAIPEGLVAVVTIALSIGMTKMAKRNAIVRRLTAVETLGCTQIICSDKTGTLTQNKMTVVESYGDTALLARAMALCCDSKLSPDGSILGDPTENALIYFAAAQGYDISRLKEEYPRIAEAPFDSVRKMMSTIHNTPGGIVQYTKGAPDEIFRVCTHALIDGKAVEMTVGMLNDLSRRNEKYADGALRVLACAYRNLDAVPEDTEPENIEKGLTFIGLEAMIDPVRPEVKAAVEECRSSGVKVVMITGDHKDTAVAIAKEIGIITSAEQAVTGRELEGMSDEEFERLAENIFVYARVQPEHKVRIVNMWKKKGYITAMTGDGVNDAPAIKSGDIGVGMGISGTDVTKNVADMVLADDNFATIVSAVGEGRRIYDNIQKTIQFLLSTNLSEVLSVFVASLMGFVLFQPVHLLFINLVTDSLPAVALSMEEAEPGIMERPPRGMKEGVFSNGVGVGIIHQGIYMAILTLAAYIIVEARHGHEAGSTAAFLMLCLCELFRAFSARSLTASIFKLKKSNKALWGALAFSFIMCMLVIYTPGVNTMFELVRLDFTEFAVSLVLAFSIIPYVEIIKAIQGAAKKRIGNRG